MSNTMEYKGYVGSVEFSEKDGVFFGKVMGIRAMISYEGENAHDLVGDFTARWTAIWKRALPRESNPKRRTKAASMSASPRSSASRRLLLPRQGRCL